jgi:hypothetical protein
VWTRGSFKDLIMRKKSPGANHPRALFGMLMVLEIAPEMKGCAAARRQRMPRVDPRG